MTVEVTKYAGYAVLGPNGEDQVAVTKYTAYAILGPIAPDQAVLTKFTAYAVIGLVAPDRAQITKFVAYAVEAPDPPPAPPGGSAIPRPTRVGIRLTVGL